jgi:rhamnosyl/mannosyltransferase
VTVLVTNPGRQPGHYHLNDVTIIRAPRLATIASTPLSPSMPQALARLRPDITHLHFPYPVGEMSQLLAGRGRPYVITYHSDVVRQQAMLRLYRPILWRVLRGAARILATSDNYIASSAYLRLLAARCVVVPLAVDPAPFLAAQPLLSPAAVPTLLFVGRHRYYKGVDDLIRTLLVLPARLLVGGDGPMRPMWQALATQLGVADRVTFLGDVNDADLPRLYASADIFVLPASARAEAFGMVLLEAMAAGLPCITTELGTGTSFVVQNGVTGLVVPPRDPEDLAAAVNYLLMNEPQRRAMGQAGRARVLSDFTLPRLLERVEAVYQAVMGTS